MWRYNVRMAGLGGQGVVTGSHVLSMSVVKSGGHSSIVPFYGSEKRMAPVESYVRISDCRIYEIGEVIYAHVLMIYHAQVITRGKSYTMPFYWGLLEGGIVIINSELPVVPPEAMAELEQKQARVYYLPATQLATEAGTDLATNMAMVGGIAGILKTMSLGDLEEAVKERFLGGIVVSGGTAALDSVVERKFKKKAELVEKNFAAVQSAYQYAIDHNWTMKPAEAVGASAASGGGGNGR